MIFVVGSSKGGVGKSTIAVSVAQRFAQDEYSVVVVDTDETASAKRWGETRKKNAFTPEIPVELHPVDYEDAVIRYADQYDVIVVDVGARDYEKLLKLARVADMFLVPTSVGKNEIDATLVLGRSFQNAGNIRPDGRPIPLHVLINNVMTDRELSNARVRLSKLVGLHVMAQALRGRKAWRDVNEFGLGVSELPRRESGTAMDEFDGVYDEALLLIGAFQNSEGKGA